MKKLIKWIVIILVAFFALVMFFGSDEEDTEYAEENIEQTEYMEEHEQAEVEEYSTENRNEKLSEFFDTSVVRERGVKLKGDGNDKVTVLVYMNGSDLETKSGEATQDITEMIAAGVSENVNVIIQTMGTEKWKPDLGISSEKSERYKVVDGGVELIDDSLEQLDCTKASTLSDFIKWGADNYPADRYILQFWNHGGGPVYGFGYDQWQDEEETLTIDEMRTALSNGGVYFDFIGMDCCIMSCMEVCMALYDYCDYTILSEEFESGLGWEYTGWLKAINDNSSIDTVSLGKIAIDDNIRTNEEDQDGDSACLALIDESVMKVLYAAWTEFAYANEDALLSENYSQQIKRSGRAHPKTLSHRSEWSDGFFGLFSNFGEDALLSDYYITDIMAVAQNISSKESDALSAAVASGIIYSRATSDDDYMTGLSVTLPYGDRDFYNQLKAVFEKCEFDDTYIKWLGNFVTAEGSREFYDYDERWGDNWDGWDEYENEYEWSIWNLFNDEEYWEDGECFGWDEYYYDDDCYYCY